MAVSRTGRLTKRLEFYTEENIKNDDGDLEPVKVPQLKCWAEIDKYSVREFRYKTENNIEGIQKRKNVSIFKIRHKQRVQVDSSMFFTFNGKDFAVEEIVPDYRDQDFDLVSGVLVE